MATFGDRFSREFGADPSPEWASAVDRLTDAEIQRGLQNLAADGRAHPPNLSEFVAACRRLEPPRYLGSDPISYTQLRVAGRLPQPPKKVHDMSALRRALRDRE